MLPFLAGTHCLCVVDASLSLALHQSGVSETAQCRSKHPTLQDRMWHSQARKVDFHMLKRTHTLQSAQRATIYCKSCLWVRVYIPFTHLWPMSSLSGSDLTWALLITTSQGDELGLSQVLVAFSCSSTLCNSSRNTETPTLTIPQSKVTFP